MLLDICHTVFSTRNDIPLGSEEKIHSTSKIQLKKPFFCKGLPDFRQTEVGRNFSALPQCPVITKGWWGLSVLQAVGLHGDSLFILYPQHL